MTSSVFDKSGRLFADLKRFKAVVAPTSPVAASSGVNVTPTSAITAPASTSVGRTSIVNTEAGQQIYSLPQIQPRDAALASTNGQWHLKGGKDAIGGFLLCTDCGRCVLQSRGILATASELSTESFTSRRAARCGVVWASTAYEPTSFVILPRRQTVRVIWVRNARFSSRVPTRLRVSSHCANTLMLST